MAAYRRFYDFGQLRTGLESVPETYAGFEYETTFTVNLTPHIFRSFPVKIVKKTGTIHELNSGGEREIHFLLNREVLSTGFYGKGMRNFTVLHFPSRRHVVAKEKVIRSILFVCLLYMCVMAMSLKILYGLG